MKKTLNIILFGRKKSYFVKCTLTLIGLYLGVLFWYFNVDYLGQPIQNALVLAVCSLICISGSCSFVSNSRTTMCKFTDRKVTLFSC